MTTSVEAAVWSLLGDLRQFEIRKPDGLSVNCTIRLLQMPRSGKAGRIDYYNLQLPKRSVFDHVVSLSFHADTLRRAGFCYPDPIQLAECIAFHDLCEILAGDVPDFTAPPLWEQHRRYKKHTAESHANALLLTSMPCRLRPGFLRARQLLRRKTSGTTLAFNMLDKTDPIIAIWRYMRTFGRRLGESFLLAMADFFDNPTPQASSSHQLLKTLVYFLQDRDNARNYLKDGRRGLDHSLPSEIRTLFDELIEDRSPMHFVGKLPASSFGFDFTNRRRR